MKLNKRNVIARFRIRFVATYRSLISQNSYIFDGVSFSHQLFCLTPTPVRLVSIGYAKRVLYVDTRNDLYIWAADAWLRVSTPGPVVDASIAADGEIQIIEQHSSAEPTRLFRRTGTGWYEMTGISA